MKQFALLLPMFNKYKIYIIIAAFLAIVAATAITLNSFYNKGYERATAECELKIQKMKAAMDELKLELEREQANIKEKVITKYVDKVRIIKEKEYVYVDQTENVPTNCELSNGWVYLHDASVRGDNAESARVSDATSSGIADNRALATVIQNYSIHQQTVEQLKALQDWIRQTQESIEVANGKRK